MISLLLLALGCGGAPPAQETPHGDTAGGGSETNATAQDEPRTAVVMRTTTPIPLPLPPTPREELPAALQRLWDRVERTIAVGPPDPPTETTSEGITDWAEGPFKNWSELRRHAIDECKTDNAQLGEDASPGDRSIAAALFGYVHEDTAARIRGAPVPVELAEDAELLAAYTDALESLTRPIAIEAAHSYSYCAVTLNQLGDPAWGEWMQYCASRAVELAEVFDLPLGARQAGGDQAGPSEDASE